jgi:hypothetical protein
MSPNRGTSSEFRVFNPSIVGTKSQYSNHRGTADLEGEMAELPKFALTHNEKKDRWDLTKDA